MKIVKEQGTEKIIQYKRELSDSKRKKFIEEQISKLLEIDGFDEKKLREQLNKVGIYTIPMMPENTGAFYRKGEMFFIKPDLISKDINFKRERLHEALHGIIGTYNISTFKTAYGLEEGIVENIVELLYEEKGLHKKEEGVRFNLSEVCQYCSDVSIIRQLEYITGKRTSDIASKGDTSFLEQIISIYRKEGFDDIVKKTNVLSKAELKDEKEIMALKKLQQKLLTVAFDEEIKEVTSLESAEKFLERLRKFERLRAAVHGDASFKTYYMEKSKQVGDLLLEAGVEKEKIQELLEKYRYLGWSINPKETEEQRANRIKMNLKEYLIENIKYKEMVTEKFIRSLEIRYYLRNGVECQIILRNGIPFGGIIRNTTDGTIITYKMVGEKIVVDSKTNKKYGEVTFDPEILKGSAEGFETIEVPGDKREFTEEVLTEIIFRRIMKAIENNTKQGNER